MRSLLSFALATLTDPLFLAVVVDVTGPMLTAGAIPYRPGSGGGNEPRRLFVNAPDVFSWLGAARAPIGFLRAFVVLARHPLRPQTTEIRAVRDAVVGATLSAVSKRRTAAS